MDRCSQSGHTTEMDTLKGEISSAFGQFRLLQNQNVSYPICGQYQLAKPSNFAKRHEPLSSIPKESFKPSVARQVFKSSTNNLWNTHQQKKVPPTFSSIQPQPKSTPVSTRDWKSSTRQNYNSLLEVLSTIPPCVKVVGSDPSIGIYKRYRCTINGCDYRFRIESNGNYAELYYMRSTDLSVVDKK